MTKLRYEVPLTELQVDGWKSVFLRNDGVLKDIESCLHCRKQMSGRHCAVQLQPVPNFTTQHHQNYHHFAANSLFYSDLHGEVYKYTY